MRFPPQHPRPSRRTLIQAGAVGLLGLGANHVDLLRASDSFRRTPRKNVIFIFLSGGLSQHDSFDMKPEAPDDVRGEFRPIATRTPSVQICEHLPKLAARSEQWALVRSLTHPYNEHSEGHMVMLSGKTPLPRGFRAAGPGPGDWPSIAAIANDQFAPCNNLPPAIALPERLVHRTGRVIPGQFAGLMGAQRDPWFVSASPFNAKTYGAFPDYEFHHARGSEKVQSAFRAPNLSLPEELGGKRLNDRMALRRVLDGQLRDMESAAAVAKFDRFRQSAVSLLADGEVQRAFDVTAADPKRRDLYGRHSFGSSLLMAAQLVEAGVTLVQVIGKQRDMGHASSGVSQPEELPFPPTDQAVSALLDDLAERGLLDDTLIVMAGEFGRTPRIFKIPSATLAGRDHWGAVQTIFLAGGGVRGGTVVGSSDRKGAYPASDPQRPENLAATIYNVLGLPATASWRDDEDRPHHIYHGDPIHSLF